MNSISYLSPNIFEELVKQARKNAAKTKLGETNAAENMVDDQEKMEEEMM